MWCFNSWLEPTLNTICFFCRNPISTTQVSCNQLQKLLVSLVSLNFLVGWLLRHLRTLLTNRCNRSWLLFGQLVSRLPSILFASDFLVYDYGRWWFFVFREYCSYWLNLSFYCYFLLSSVHLPNGFNGNVQYFIARQSNIVRYLTEVFDFET